MYGRPPPSWQTNPNNPNIAPMATRQWGGGPPPPMGNGAGPSSGGEFPRGPPTRPPPNLGHNAAGSPNPVHGYVNSPAGPSTAGPSSIVQDPSTTVFVGSITPGISDGMLKELLNTCGVLVNLKRISPAFGFASFDHPEAAMRAIDLLNGLALPPPGVTDRFEIEGKTKKLVVKADEKTKALLEEYKAGRSSRSTQEEELDSAGKARIEALMNQLRSPEVLALFGDSSTANSTAVPAHLKDLPPEDLPEEHRKSVLSEIDKFRQASAAREEEKKRKERVLERERMQAQHAAPPRASTGPRGAAGDGGPPAGPNGFGPQSFNQGAPSFVRPQGDAPAARSLESLDPEEADEIEEKRRQELKAREEEHRGQEALAEYSHRERARITHWTRIIDESNAEKHRRSKTAAQFLSRCDAWDTIAPSELFYSDRSRWRHFRGPMLRREVEEDEKDQKLEAEEEEQAKKETEKFLARQEEEMKKHLEEQRKAGVLVEGSNMQPLKLKIGAGIAADAASAPTGPVGPGGVLGESAEEAVQSRKAALMNVSLDDGLSPEERAAVLASKRADLQSTLSSYSRGELFNNQPQWDWIDESAIKATYSTLVSEAVQEAVGESVPELEDVVLELIRSRQSAEKIVEAVEPVMAEDASSFAEGVWRALILESTIAASGLVAP